MVYTARIYKLEYSKDNSNFYIGQTYKALSQRFTNHKLSAKRGIDTRLYRAMRKHGIDAFIIKDIEICDFETKEESKVWMNEREVYYISTLQPIYNTAPGGLGHTGVAWTDERRARVKENMSGENNPNFGKTLSAETRQKLSEALKGRIISDETRSKTSKTMKGITKSEETRKKMSETRKGWEMPKGRDSKKAISVDQFDLEGKLIKTFGSIADAATELGCQRSGICFCLKGRIKSSAGYVWKYSPH